MRESSARLARMSPEADDTERAPAYRAGAVHSAPTKELLP
jgi:hypothetical protein